MEQADVIIIGAGACGLMAARELSGKGLKVVILEARARCGGRIHTIMSHGFSHPVEEGAAFMHGELPLTRKLLKQAGAELLTITGDILERENGAFRRQEDFVKNGELVAEKVKALKEDMSVEAFLNTYFSGAEYEALRNDTIRYLEGYDLADIARASAKAMGGDAGNDDTQYRISGGYERLVSYLEEGCVKNGCVFFLERVVKEIYWSAGEVQAVTANGESYAAAKVIVTVPLGVLQSEEAEATINFLPVLPDKLNAAKNIGFGSVVKIMLEFASPFWSGLDTAPDLSDTSFIFSNERVPTWWTQQPIRSNLLTGWLGGPDADKLCGATDQQLLAMGITSLAALFDMKEADIRSLLKAWHVYNWKTDPYAKGAYGYATLGGRQAKQVLMIPVQDTIFFAGEGVYDGNHIGTVEAALADGLRVSKLIA